MLFLEGFIVGLFIGGVFGLILYAYIAINNKE